MWLLRRRKHEGFSGRPGDHRVPPGKGSGYGHTPRAEARFLPAANKQGEDRSCREMRESICISLWWENLIPRPRLQKSKDKKHHGLALAGESPQPWAVRSRPRKQPLGPRCWMSENKPIFLTLLPNTRAGPVCSRNEISKHGFPRSPWLLVRMEGKSDPLPPAVERTPHRLGSLSPEGPPRRAPAVA